MRVNLVKVCKASNARKLAFAYLSRSHGRLYETCHFSGLVELSSLGKRHQKASAAAKVRKARKRKNLFLHFLAEAKDAKDLNLDGGSGLP